MLLTIFLAIVVCAAVVLMMFAGVVFIQDTKLFSSAPKEFRKVLKPKDKELLKLLVVFPAISALAAWICTLF